MKRLYSNAWLDFRLNRTTTTSTVPPTEVTPTPSSIATTTSSGSKRTVEEIYDEVDVSDNSSSNTDDD